MKTIKGDKKAYTLTHCDCFISMICRLDENTTKLDKSDIQNKRGVYVFFDKENKPVRIGKAVKVRNRLLSYYTSLNVNESLFEDLFQLTDYIGVVYTNNETESVILELELLKKYKPILNTQHVK